MSSKSEVAWALEVAEAARRFKLLSYQPYPKQKKFHAMGAEKRERLLMAGNQQGKTYSGAAEFAYHVTGMYPDWWKGWRFEKPIRAWVAGITNEQTRDTAQATLFGPEGQEGTGLIPGANIIDYTWAKGISNFLDTMRVRHITGGESHVNFKSYQQGREKWQGDRIDFVWCDEEPPKELYGEALARTTATGGRTIITFTPLLGMTEVVGWFFPRPNAPHRGLVQMNIDDALHIPKERRDEEIAKYAPHEREARAMGIPMLGSGRVFPVAESLIAIDPEPIPDSWRRILGIDFGWDHPAALAWLAYDPETDIAYVYDAWRESEHTTEQIALVIRSRPNSDWIPVAWPHDGHHHDRGTGVEQAQMYARLGIKMLPEHAGQANGALRIEPGVQAMLDRMRSGRLKVFRNLAPWFDEFRQYHRKDGKIVAQRDDLLSATRYALACIGMARSKSDGRELQRHVASNYDPLTWGEDMRVH